MAKNGKKRGPRTPYTKPGAMTEDPLDGYAPRKHRSQKKGARQHGHHLTREEQRLFDDTLRRSTKLVVKAEGKETP